MNREKIEALFGKITQVADPEQLFMVVQDLVENLTSLQEELPHMNEKEREEATQFLQGIRKSLEQKLEGQEATDAECSAEEKVFLEETERSLHG